MQNLTYYFKRALQEKWALPHFNISTFEQLKAMANVAARLKTPLHIGTSPGEADYLGMRQSVGLVALFRAETGVPLFLNADHFHSVKEAKAAVDAGYDSINIDLSEKPYEENIKGVKEVVEYSKAKNADISVEGELGYLRGSSKMQKEIIEIKLEDTTDPAQIREYIKETGVDRVAPAVGNIHGIAANVPHLDFERIEAIRALLPDTVALVLHGGSGITDTEIRRAIQAGMNNVHVNTEIRIVYSNAIRAFLTDHPNETTPYKILPSVIEAMEKKIEEKIRLFGAVDKI